MSVDRKKTYLRILHPIMTPKLQLSTTANPRGSVTPSIFTKPNWNIHTNLRRHSPRSKYSVFSTLVNGCFSCRHKSEANVVLTDGGMVKVCQNAASAGLCVPPLIRKRVPSFIYSFLNTYCSNVLSLEAASRILIVWFPSSFCLRRGSITFPQPTQAFPWTDPALQGGLFWVHKSPLHVSHWTFTDWQAGTKKQTIPNPTA